MTKEEKNKRMKLKLILFLILIPFLIKAQQLTESSEFSNTNFVFNPAQTAQNDYLEAHALYRREWTGFDQAPRNLNVGLQFPFVNNNAGVGLNVHQDQLGVFRQTDISLSYAYHVPIASGQTLSFGLAVHLSQFRIKESEIIATDGNDDFAVEGSGSEFQANVGAGFSYQTKSFDDIGQSYFFLAAGVNQLIPNDLIFNDVSKSANFNRVLHIFGNIGYRFQLDYAFVEPSLQFNSVTGNVSKFRFHVNYELEDRFWAGLALDSNVRVGLQGGVIVNETDSGQIRIGGLASYGASTITESQGLGYSIYLGYLFGL